MDKKGKARDKELDLNEIVSFFRGGGQERNWKARGKALESKTKGTGEQEEKNWKVKRKELESNKKGIGYNYLSGFEFIYTWSE